MSEATCICFHCGQKLLVDLAFNLVIYGHDRELHLCCLFKIIEEQLYHGDFKELGTITV